MTAAPDSSPLETHFPNLLQDPSLRTALQEQSQSITLSPEAFICMEGTMCAHLALVLDGQARVYKSGAEGREITLYRVHPGESCILTTSCILSDRPFPAFAVAETELTARLVPAPTVKQWMERHVAWREYVFDLLARRLDAVIGTLEEVAFRRLDARLAATLLDAHAAAEGDTIRTTHEQLAADLGSAREVISRLLKHFEQDDVVSLARGAITIQNREALRRIARGPRR
jgi:CRP/FNR family transcriptional regulator